MKKFNLLIIVLLVLNQCRTTNTENKTTSDIQQDVQKTGKLVGDPLKPLHEIEENRKSKFQFEIIEIINYDLNGDNKTDTIKIEKLADWDDPGDYHLIRVIIDGKEFSYFNIQGWVKSSYFNEYLNMTSDNLVQSKYVVLKAASSKDLLILLNGYIYASSPGLLTVISIYDNNAPQLIFNEDAWIYKWEDLNNDYTKDLVITKFDKYYLENEKIINNPFRVYLLNKWYSFDTTLSNKIYSNFKK